MPDKSPFSASPDGVYLDVWAQPRASKTRVSGIHDGALKIQLAAPPVDGEANDELIRFLAKTLGIPKNALELTQGTGSRKKRVFVKKLGIDEVISKLT